MKRLPVSSHSVNAEPERSRMLGEGSRESFHNTALWLWFQVQHVVECERILSNLLEKTPETHRDYTELGKVVSKFKQVCVHVSVFRSCLNSCEVLVGWWRKALFSFTPYSKWSCSQANWCMLTSQLYRSPRASDVCRLNSKNWKLFLSNYRHFFRNRLCLMDSVWVGREIRVTALARVSLIVLFSGSMHPHSGPLHRHRGICQT